MCSSICEIWWIVKNCFWTSQQSWTLDSHSLSHSCIWFISWNTHRKKFLWTHIQCFRNSLADFNYMSVPLCELEQGCKTTIKFFKNSPLTSLINKVFPPAELLLTGLLLKYSYQPIWHKQFYGQIAGFQDIYLVIYAAEWCILLGMDSFAIPLLIISSMWYVI